MAAVAVCVMAAGCGVAAGSTKGPPAPVPVQTGPAATAAGNRAAAEAEAARLLSLARVPPGALRLAGPPRSLQTPAQSEMATSTVDRDVAWQIGLPFATVRTWFSAHPPRGLSSDGSSSYTNGGQVTEIGDGYSGPASQAWQSADLVFSIVAAGPHASAIRADAEVVWLDPRPLPSSPGAHPVRVTVMGGCPSSDQDVTGVTNPGPRLTSRLLPPGPPGAGLLCRYDGSNGHPWHLAAATWLTAAAARQAAAAMTRMPLSHPDGEVVSCPAADGSAEILALAYPGRTDVDLWITLGGCGGVSNGQIMTTA